MNNTLVFSVLLYRHFKKSAHITEECATNFGTQI